MLLHCDKNERCNALGGRYNGAEHTRLGKRNVEEFVILGLVLLLLLGAYWSMVIFPRQRDFQKRQRFARELSAGDEVITYGGLIGRVIDIDAEMGIAHVQIAEGVVARFVTAALIQPYNAEEIANAAKQGIEQHRAP